MDVVRIILMWLNLEQTGRTLWMAARSANYIILMRLEQNYFQSVHPGYAKGKMINSMLIANDFIITCWRNSEETKGYEGFFHVH
jgi:hypothetical protein